MPPHFQRIAGSGIKAAISDYSADTRGVFPFDPDHAMVAFPLHSLSEVSTLLRATGGNGFDQGELDFLRKNCRDKHRGELTSLAGHFR